MNIESRIGKWSVIFGIVIVLNLFFNYTLSLVYEQSSYEAYCPQSQVVTIPDTQAQCVAEGGQWTADMYYRPLFPAETINEPSKIRDGYCDLQFTCRQEYDKARETHGRNVFVVLVILGAISVFVGNFFKGNLVISNGLALGGLLSFIIASMRYWSAANDIFRVIILLISLGILFWIAWKKFNDRVRSENN